MLPLGRMGIRAERGDDRRTRFTRDEQYAMMTLWCIFRSPLMMGGDLPSNDDFTLALLTNDGVLAVNQTSAGNRELLERGSNIAWIADAPGKTSKYLALFNIGDSGPANAARQAATKEMLKPDLPKRLAALREKGSLKISFRFEKNLTVSSIEISFNEIGLSGPGLLRDLWQQKDLGSFEGRAGLEVAAHGARLVKVTPRKGS